MGLGTTADVSLAEAREAAAQARRLVRQGIDPIEQRRKERAEKAAERGLNTFAEVADAYIAAHSPSWRNAKHRQQWRNTLNTYVIPVLGSMPVGSARRGRCHPRPRAHLAPETRDSVARPRAYRGSTRLCDRSGLAHG